MHTHDYTIRIRLEFPCNMKLTNRTKRIEYVGIWWQKPFEFTLTHQHQAKSIEKWVKKQQQREKRMKPNKNKNSHDQIQMVDNRKRYIRSNFALAIWVILFYIEINRKQIPLQPRENKYLNVYTTRKSERKTYQGKRKH